ncbi:nucleotidyltransferase domain-containing protein [Roseibium sp. LAB1]
MSVDPHGFIDVVENHPFQDEFSLLLQDVRTRLCPSTVPLVHSVYVYGSVATGKAVAGRSDLDVSLILHDLSSKHDSKLIEDTRQALEAAHSIVIKVDFDIGLLQDVLSADSAVAWRYWLRHHCRCIAGEDLAEGVPLFRPSRMLALAVNGDFEQVLGKYHSMLSASPPASACRRLVREASRKLIRSTNVLRTDSDRDWPDTLEEHVTSFQRHFPTHGDELRYFLRQVQEPDATPEYFAERLKTFVDWMSDVVGNCAQ